MDGNLGGHLLFGAIGIPLLIVGFVMARSSFRLKREGIRASAVVAAYESDGEAAWPVVEFDDRSGKRHGVQLSCSEGPPVGEAMEVLYEHDAPEEAVGSSGLHLWLGPLILIGLGSVFVAQVGQAFGVLDLGVMAMAAGISAIVFGAAWAASWWLGGAIGAEGKAGGADASGPDLTELIEG